MTEYEPHWAEHIKRIGRIQGLAAWGASTSSFRHTSDRELQPTRRDAVDARLRCTCFEQGERCHEAASQEDGHCDSCREVCCG